jgi:hypothetical protein
LWILLLQCYEKCLPISTYEAVLNDHFSVILHCWRRLKFNRHDTGLRNKISCRLSCILTSIWNNKINEIEQVNTSFGKFANTKVTVLYCKSATRRLWWRNEAVRAPDQFKLPLLQRGKENIMGNGSFTQIKSITRIEARQNVPFRLRMHFHQNGPTYGK